MCRRGPLGVSRQNLLSERFWCSRGFSEFSGKNSFGDEKIFITIYCRKYICTMSPKIVAGLCVQFLLSEVALKMSGTCEIVGAVGSVFEKSDLKVPPGEREKCCALQIKWIDSKGAEVSHQKRALQ